MTNQHPESTPDSASEAGRTVYRGVLDVLTTGVAVIVPFVVTVYVLTVVLGLALDALGPFVGLLQWLGVTGFFEQLTLQRLFLVTDTYGMVLGIVADAVAVSVLFGVVFLVGTVARNRHGERAIHRLDRAIAAVPGVGTVYDSFRRMGDVMLDDGAENFREVALIEWSENVYVLGFVTNDSAPETEVADGRSEGEGEDMVAVFVPMAPNPVTGGFLTYVPRSELHDVDMTPSEGVQTVLTSGVASGVDSSARA